MDVKEGSWFDIPLGALQSDNIGNLYAAGRMISADETAFAAVRVMGTCFVTGHSAGVAAAVQAEYGEADIRKIRAELDRQLYYRRYSGMSIVYVDSKRGKKL